MSPLSQVNDCALTQAVGCRREAPAEPEENPVSASVPTSCLILLGSHSAGSVKGLHMTDWIDLGPNWPPMHASDLRRDLTELRELREAKFRMETELRELRSHVDRLESRRPSVRRSAGKPRKQRNRVIYHVTAVVSDRADDLLALLWQQRNPATDVSMKVAAGSVVNATTLRFVIDYTVKGGYPADVVRMLEKTARGLNISVLEVDCDEQSREPAESDESAA